VLEAFLGAVSAFDTGVAHSVDFDRSVVGAEMAPPSNVSPFWWSPTSLSTDYTP